MRAYQDEARVFKAFCDPRRLQVLALLQQGEQCVCVLLQRLDMPQSTLSYHLKVLCDAGVVDRREDGKWSHYRISREGSANAAALLKTLTTVLADPVPENIENTKESVV